MNICIKCNGNIEETMEVYRKLLSLGCEGLGTLDLGKIGFVYVEPGRRLGWSEIFIPSLAPDYKIHKPDELLNDELSAYFI